MLGNLTNREHVFGSSKPAQYGKTHIHRNESKLNDLDQDKGVQSADKLHGCHRECEGKWPGDGWWATAERNNCKWWCHLRDTHDGFRSDSQESTPTDIKSTLQDIGDNFYALADSASVL